MILVVCLMAFVSLMVGAQKNSRNDSIGPERCVRDDDARIKLKA